MALVFSNLWILAAIASIILLFFLIKHANLKLGELIALIATLAMMVLALSRFEL
ncbi:MAG: hypothetical protein Q4G44_08885 [Alcaligenaceae bacterium]|nr:hypothetical protein [Alcaligenaceae bacterium]